MAIQKKKESFKCMHFFQKFTYGVVTTTELFFYRLGILIGKEPIKVIGICWLVVFLSAFGFLRFQQEKNPLKLWVPPHTSFVRDSEWLMKSLQRGYRQEGFMMIADDVLDPKVIQKLAEIDYQVRHVESPNNNLTLRNVCFEIPKIDKGMLRMLESEINDTRQDPSGTMDPAMYCSFVESMRNECYTKSILDLWDFNQKKIKFLTKEDIIKAVNNYDKNTMFGKLKNIEDLLGNVTRNESGHIVGAKVLQNFWFLRVNMSSVDMDKTGNNAGTADWASVEALDWENAFLGLMQNVSKTLNNTYYYAGRSFGDISNDTMFADMDLLCIGIFMMVIYVQLVISKFNWLEARVVLGSVGLLSIGMSFVVGAGLCSLFGVYYGPVHTSLPFLLMGLGVDDMFVILSCWDDLDEEEQKLPIPEKIGLMLKHAGVSITITSFTDVIAFIIGASTILPCLESFCIYAAVGVLMTFIFAVTFFVACFVLDQRRVESKRNGVFPWIVHDDYEPNRCSQSRLSNRVFEYVYSNIILTTPGKVTVILITLTCLGFSIESALRLEQRFDPKWFLPDDSHLAEFLKVQKSYYPEKGYEGGFYMGAIDYAYEINKIRGAVGQLENMSDITTNVVSWVEPFHQFVLFNFKHDVYEEPLDDVRFRIFLSKFLNSPRYAKYQANFIFDGPLECGAATPTIKMSIVDFDFHRFENPRDHIPAMHRVRDIAENINFTTGEKFATAWSLYFSSWITDELIDIEVMRNLQLALLCVMLCTILLIADWQTCFWIFICVLITMVNVCGFMQRWGLTIDLVSCIGLELAIGLCVDYATHVGHTFLTVHKGSRQERTIKTISTIGCAVLFGGLSTFIGVFMLSQSKVYTFQSFFKIFLLVIFFGLFHGIVFLPVMLSWIGPKPYRVHKPVAQHDTEMS